tara:strand:+ start:80 stop:1771 length:1692 start_codon:yes stop_codon:yes gene_type:complete
MGKIIHRFKKYPGTLVLPGDSFDTHNLQILGRRVAGKEFLQGIASNLKDYEELDILVTSEKDKEYLRSIINPLVNKKNNIQIHTSLKYLDLNKIENIHIPGPDIEKWSIIRAGYNSNKFSITGIIHTLCSNTIINGFKEYIFGGLESWDALVCTSSTGKQVVQKIINYYNESFERKYKIRLSSEKIPKLFKIPLAVNDITFDNSLTREEKRLKSREKLGISKDAIVILFLGRLSFHGKAHPLTLYKSISKISSQNKNKEIILLECGTFPNKNAERLYNELIRSFNSLIVKRVGGISKASEESKIDALNSSDIFVSLSDNIQETFGLTLIEAMAAKLPCIVSDWDGYRDIVKDNQTGYLIPTKYPKHEDDKIDNLDKEYKIGNINFDYMIGLKSMKTVIDEDALEKKLDLLINNKEVRSKMANESRKRYESVFTWTVVSYQYRELWSNLREIREKNGKNERSYSFHPSIDYMFKEYATERYNEKELIVKELCIKPEILSFHLHSKLVDIITSNHTNKIIDFLNNNKRITIQDLTEIGIDQNKQIEIMALIEKLGIAKSNSQKNI